MLLGLAVTVLVGVGVGSKPGAPMLKLYATDVADSAPSWMRSAAMATAPPIKLPLLFHVPM